MSMEQITISGRLGRDAELKTTARGNRYVTFTLAVDSKNKSGEATTNWYTISSFNENHTGKFMEYLKKGHGLIVTGAPSYSIWTDKTGNPRMDLNVRAYHMEFPSMLGGKEDKGEQTQKQSAPVQEKTQAPAPQYAAAASVSKDPEDDLPF